jgi:hypothetical protein
MAKLYTVYENGDRAIGLETLGPQRHVIHVNGNVLLSEQTVALEALAPLLGDLMRQGYRPTSSGSYYSKQNGFQQCHPDFDLCKGKYTIFCTPPDIAKAVSDIQTLGDTCVFDALHRTVFMDWLRSLDMNESYLVVPHTNQEFTLLLAEVAIKENLTLHAASVGIPTVCPSQSLNLWASWLSIPQEKLRAMFPMFKTMSWTAQVGLSQGSEPSDTELDLFS